MNRYTENSRSNLSNATYRIIAVITIIVSVIGLLMSPVSAVPGVSPSGTPTGKPAGTSTPRHILNITQEVVTRLQIVLTNLNRQGVDVSQARTDLGAGNVSAATRKLMEYHKDHPGLALNGPPLLAFNITQEVMTRLQIVLTNLNRQGVDVSQARTDLAAGNVKAAMQWIEAYQKVHSVHSVSNVTRSVSHGANSTQLHHPGSPWSGNQTRSGPHL
jgi:hypothetical protein